jgi:hypothetical protein
MEVLAQRGLDVHFSGISFCLDGAKNHISLHCIFFPKHFQERVNDEVLKIEGVSKMKPVCQLRPWKH